MECLEYYDYIREFIFNYFGATWNKIVHDGVYVGVAQSLSGGSADLVLLQVHF
jgi:molybdopterin-containing oxidoreductase family iron-sulfur binding subunit